MTARYRVILNPRSGRVLALDGRSASQAEMEQRIKELFAASACPECRITRLGPQVDLQALARSDGPEVVYIAGGGDGTVNAVANAVAGTPRAMGVLPVGTLNHFARDLNLPFDLAEAVRVIAAGHTRQIDAAEVNGHIFVNNSSLGAYPAMVVDRERMKKLGRNKWAALVAASIRAFIRFRCLRVEMNVDGAQRVCTTPFLFVGNNEYCLEGSQLGRRERVDRGILSLYMAPGASRMGILRMGLAALFGRLRQSPEYHESQVSEFSVHVRGRRLRVSLDGEVLRMIGPLRYRILPGALCVLAPPAHPNVDARPDQEAE